MRSLRFFLSLLSVAVPYLTFANGCGAKWDIAPIFAHLDVLSEGHTIKTLDMGGLKTNGTIMLKEGWGFCVKPDILYAQGHGELISGSLGFGHVTPVTDKICLTPCVGWTMTNLRTSIVKDVIVTPDEEKAPGYKVNLGPYRFRNRFRSTAPFIALEATYKLGDGWRVGASIQYSWSRCHTRTVNKNLPYFEKSKSYSAGPSYSAMIEKDLNDQWSVNVGATYNVSLDKSEMEGLRGYGFKLGIARWF